MAGIVVLKFIHYLALFWRAGLVLAVLSSSRCMSKCKRRQLTRGQGVASLGLIGLGALVVLWLTGIGLAHAIYGTLALGSAFYVKLLGAGLLLAASAAANLHLHKSMQAGHRRMQVS